MSVSLYVEMVQKQDGGSKRYISVLYGNNSTRMECYAHWSSFLSFWSIALANETGTSLANNSKTAKRQPIKTNQEASSGFLSILA